MRKNFFGISELLQKALDLWPQFFETHKEQLDGREGLYFAVCDIGAGYHNTAGIVVGKIPDSKVKEKMSFAWEKVSRLATGDPHALTSFFTQNYSEKKFGGGIKTSDFIVSCSGLPPEIDHQFVLKVLKEYGNLGHIEEKNIQTEFEKYKNTGK